jgi:hypothetical protein
MPCPRPEISSMDRNAVISDGRGAGLERRLEILRRYNGLTSNLTNGPWGHIRETGEYRNRLTHARDGLGVRCVRTTYIHREICIEVSLLRTNLAPNPRLTIKYWGDITVRCRPSLKGVS